MDFNDTPQEAKFRAEVRAWLQANVEPHRPDDAAADAMSEKLTQEEVDAAKAWQRKKADAGWACLRWPKEYGGRGATSWARATPTSTSHACPTSTPPSRAAGTARVR